MGSTMDLDPRPVVVRVVPGPTRWVGSRDARSASITSFAAERAALDSAEAGLRVARERLQRDQVGLLAFAAAGLVLLALLAWAPLVLGAAR